MAASPKPPCRRSAWPDLALDILGDVLSRLPSLADHVHLRAVCRPWHTGAKLLPLPPPPLPWIAFSDGIVLDVGNKRRYRLHLPKHDGTCYSAGENMFFLHHKDGRCSMVNGFSGVATPLPELAPLLKFNRMVNPCDSNFGREPSIRKVVMSSPASSPDHHH